MRAWKGFVGIAVLILVCGGALAFGDDTNSNSMNNGNDQVPPSDQVEPPPPAPEEPAAAPAAAPTPAQPTYGPLMQLFEQIGIGKPMENLGFNIHGYVEGGYLYDMTVPNDVTPARSAPGDDIFFAGPYKNAVMLNQADIMFERDMVNLPKGDWDFGFGVETGYGRDDYFTHSNGVLDQHNKQGGTGNDDQLDLLQIYGQLGIPLGTGITVEAGKFLSLLGYEQIDPSQNLFYTHSYGFSYGKPFTMTGILGAYTFFDPSTPTNNTTITAGVTRGWNQTLYDNNDDPDMVIQAKTKTGNFDWTVNLMIGPEGVLPYGPPDDTHWWVVPEAIAVFRITDQLILSGDLLYGDAPDLTNWFSAAGYFQWKLDPHVSLGLRAEFYHDGHGVTTGIGGSDVNYWEITLGTTVVPMPDSPLLSTFEIRPEIRFDDADQPAFDFSKRNEVTAAVDLVYRF